ncbi:MAG: hypothetical protein OEZ51_12840 [Nitrospinota bacterium]|nr:hypothetical protein [Nitrospinota bacterium]
MMRSWGTICHYRKDDWLAIHHTRKAEAIYSKLFGTEHGTAIQLRQNLEGYYKQYFLRPEDFESQS